MTDRDTINRVLAERVMGWTAYNFHRDGYWWNRGDDVVGLSSDAWNPMDNIAQAMMVAEKLHEIGKKSNPAVYHQLMLRYDVFRNYEGALMWTASFGTGGRGDANTPSEAISRAAYEVVKGEQ